ncbi:MAG TPA: SpoIIE family protein phosphatase [Bacteroidia bacterium]|nr:SpoIIE family protein phosphatase [Bacteroidia bacterium]
MSFLSAITEFRQPQIMRALAGFFPGAPVQEKFVPGTDCIPDRPDEIRAELLSHLEIFNQSALLTISDLKGNIIHANEKFCQVAGYSMEEVMGKPHSIIRHPDMPSSVFKEMWRTIGSGKVWQGEIKNRAKDGSAYWVMATIAPVMGKNGKPERYISVRYDITKQKRVEEELREAQKRMDRELMESIGYAKYIHGTILNNNDERDEAEEDSFLIYKACRMISGDFYKVRQDKKKLTFAVGDSTGHGVSASYISVLALSILNRLADAGCRNPAETLRKMNTELNRITHSDRKKHLLESADLMIGCIDKKTLKMTYASARMRGVVVRNGEVIALEKDKCTIGDKGAHEFEISSRTINLQKGDRLYIYSDGFTDQLGSAENKRFGQKRVLSLLKEVCQRPMHVQKQLIEEQLLAWQDENGQTDDITVLAFRI